MDIEELKFKEINILLSLFQTKSVRELARQRGTTAGHISKVIQGVETKLGFQLVNRSNLGVLPTPKAQEILPILEEAIDFQRRLQSPSSKLSKQDFLGFASTSFFSTHLIPQIFSQMEESYPNTRCRIIDLQPNHFIPAALRNGFQVCVHLKNMDWPKTWTSAKVGNLQWTLCCRKDHPVLKKKTVNNITKYPFVYPAYWSSEGIQYGDDHCPVPIGKRIRGYETATATAAAEVVQSTDQLAFLPELIIRTKIQSGELIPIKISSWKTVQEPVYLTVKSEYVKQKTFQWLKEAVSAELDNK